MKNLVLALVAGAIVFLGSHPASARAAGPRNHGHGVTRIRR